MHQDVGKILRCSVDISFDVVSSGDKRSCCPVTVAMSPLMAVAARRAGCPSGTG